MPYTFFIMQAAGYGKKPAVCLFFYGELFSGCGLYDGIEQLYFLLERAIQAVDKLNNQVSMNIGNAL